MLTKLGLGKVQFFAALGMIAAIGILFALWRGAESEADLYEARLAASETRHAVTTASLDRLQAEMARVMAEARERDARARQAAEDVATVRSEAAREREALEAVIARLRRPVARGPGAPCVADDDTLEALLPSE